MSSFNSDKSIHSHLKVKKKDLRREKAFNKNKINYNNNEEKQNPNPLVPIKADSDLYVTNLDPFPIDGLDYYENFLNEEEELKVIDICDSNPWLKIIRRRQQFYGEVYYHTTHEQAQLQPDESSTDYDRGILTPSLPISQFDWLKTKFETSPWKERVFGNNIFPTQILVNEYEGMSGISSHFEDEVSFGDVIATISIISPVLMSLQCPKEHNNDCQDLLASTKLLLMPKSLLIMAGDSRFKWRHGISRGARHVYLKDGSSLSRDEVSVNSSGDQIKYRRISLTIRHLKHTRRKVADIDLGITSMKTAYNTCKRYIDEACHFYSLNIGQKNIMLSQLRTYEDSNRYYHTWHHLADMFTLLDSHKAFINDRPAIIMAILYHDIIYNAKSQSNEEDSAALFEEYVNDNCNNNDKQLKEVKQKICDYIIATKAHNANASTDDDLKYFIDFDMAVLGWPLDRYKRYAGLIRDEYIHVDEKEYCSKRAAFLRSTAESANKIFATTDFQNLFEIRARENLQWECNELDHGRIPNH